MSDDGHGGTRITFTPTGAIFREGSVPVPVVAETGSKGPLEAKFFETGRQPEGGKAHIFYDEGKGALYYDRGGDSGPVKFAKVEPGLALDHSDFIVV